MTCEQIDLIRWAVSIAVPAIAGLLGVGIGAWLTGRREKRQCRLAFIEKQLKDFYSPMLGLRNEIFMRSNLRVRIHDTADIVWRELCTQASRLSPEALGELSRTRGPEFTSLTDYDNSQLRKELIPAYQQMAKLFRDSYWLAHPETRAHYEELIEFVELWERWLAKTIPAEVIQRLQHTEERLKPFYAHLEKKHDLLRSSIESGAV
ncbi:MAG: hypothetical protein P0120_05325 [Nitrospira sp.]|nr:hypothetical protein [Nitrospira sp.]